MADSVDQADAELKAADAAWTAARSKIHPSNKIGRRLGILKSDGADNPSSPDYALYQQYQQQYDAAVAEEAQAKAAYMAANENYQKVYAADNAQSPTKDENPKTPEKAAEEAAGPQAENFGPEPVTNAENTEAPVTVQESLGPGEEVVPVDTNTDPAYADYDISTTTYADYDIPPEVSPEEDPFEQSRLDAEERNNGPAPTEEDVAAAAESGPTSRGIMGSIDQVRSKPTLNSPRNQRQKDDWRVRLSLAPSAKYLYRDPSISVADLLYPLAGTDGVIFPYMPQINSSYKANYEPSDLIHSNFKTYFYKNSSVDDITLIADFTAQDSSEANYMLAVIHFFKSVTKMFYGQDGKNGGPKSGTPPPLCYLNGLGTYQFNDHPVVVTSFSYNLPNDVDYIRAGAAASIAGQNTESTTPKKSSMFDFDMASIRAKLSGLTKGAISKEPQFNSLSKENSTYVPTKIQLTIGLLPIVTRSDMSKNFSLQDYATGKLLKGSQRNGRGIW